MNQLSIIDVILFRHYFNKVYNQNREGGTMFRFYGNA